MTNAEKYLKVSVNEFFRRIIESKIDISGLYSLEKWLLDEAKPTLTEDERVILRNIAKDYSKVFRNGEGRLFFYNQKRVQAIDNHKGVFSHLFQFIKERRRI